MCFLIAYCKASIVQVTMSKWGNFQHLPVFSALSIYSLNFLSFLFGGISPKNQKWVGLESMSCYISSPRLETVKVKYSVHVYMNLDSEKFDYFWK